VTKNLEIFCELNKAFASMRKRNSRSAAEQLVRGIQMAGDRNRKSEKGDTVCLKVSSCLWAKMYTYTPHDGLMLLLLLLRAAMPRQQRCRPLLKRQTIDVWLELDDTGE